MLLPLRGLAACLNPAARPASPACLQERYNEIAAEMKHMLVRVGWKPDFVEKSVPILPISGWMGDNLIKKSTNMTWWSGCDALAVDGAKIHIETLLDALNGFVQVGRGGWLARVACQPGGMQRTHVVPCPASLTHAAAASPCPAGARAQAGRRPAPAHLRHLQDQGCG